MLVEQNSNWLAERTFSEPDRMFIKTDKISYTFKEFYNISLGLSELLKKNQPGTGLAAVLSDKPMHHIVSASALWNGGMTPVLLNHRKGEEEITSIITHLNPDFILSDQPLPEIKNTILPLQNFFANFEIHHSVNRKHLKFEPDNNALVIYTSGTTGRPAGVMHSFRSLYSSVNNLYSEISFGENDSWLASLPFYHIGGFAIFTRALISGGSIIVPDSYDTDTIAKYIQKYDPQFISLVPTMLKRLDRMGIKPGEKLKCLFLGGGPAEKEFVADMIGKGWPVFLTYGSTETGSMVVLNKTEELKNDPAKTGKPIADNLVKIINADKEGTGEIAVRSPSLFKGYLNNRELTDARFSGKYYLTGDRGRIDKKGFLEMTGRRSDLIISGGENLSAAAIREKIISVNGVKDCFVLPIKDDEWGEAPGALIITDGENNSMIEEKMKQLLKTLEYPKRIIFSDELPLLETGKPDYPGYENYSPAIDKSSFLTSSGMAVFSIDSLNTKS